MPRTFRLGLEPDSTLNPMRLRAHLAWIFRSWFAQRFPAERLRTRLLKLVLAGGGLTVLVFFTGLGLGPGPQAIGILIGLATAVPSGILAQGEIAVHIVHALYFESRAARTARRTLLLASAWSAIALRFVQVYWPWMTANFFQYIALPAALLLLGCYLIPLLWLNRFESGGTIVYVAKPNPRDD